jgi:hypothetical protein
LPVGWYREREAHSVGVRTFPLVAAASCGYVLVAVPLGQTDLAAQSRVIQGLVAGIGFIGGGAILKAEGHEKLRTRHGYCRQHLEFRRGGGGGGAESIFLAILLAALNFSRSACCIR